MLPGGLTAGRLSVEEIAVAARTGVELGADLIKIRYQGPAAAYQAVIESCYRPLVILGGSKQPAEELLGEIGQALEAGASGAAVGRNIWQHPDPAEMTRKIRAVIHPGQV
jgi:DhnA family fructose-bisphosphate aldolase class Ia